MPVPTDDATLLAGGTSGPRALRPLLDTVLTALAEGAADRDGPLPPGGPEATAARLRAACGPVLPEHGTGAHAALSSLVRALAEGAADPADPHCAAHLHCPPLAVAAAADLAASALNPSMDSWDQAPAATALEERTTRALAALVHPREHDPDALLTTGGTESNQLGLLLARERTGPRLRVLCAASAHHSVGRSAWVLGLDRPVVLPAPRGLLDPAALDAALAEATAAGLPALVVATAGTTDTGAIDPLPAVADTAARHRAALHVDAAYGGPLLFSDRLRHRLDGLERADSVTLDLHKLGWQPVAAGLLTVPRAELLAPLGHQADYLNADDDTRAGLPDLLGRSLRTTRRPDVLKIAVTLQALGRSGLGLLVERTCAAARHLADLVEEHPRLELHARPCLSTVLFRPTSADDEQVAAIRRHLLGTGRAVLGRAEQDGRRWLKATLLNPHARSADLTALLTLVDDSAREKDLQP
ncbi:aminotransferase class V-fold PLP-dependent enzyme [Streptomyces sp. 549]|uniref:pyridoxal phosphate-dependent decarboxylase family protein n=1 Tax=Streptomyces sp. 549 TaxID=3049076 RepID=UPI0024C22BCA|nr:aminotransferase class V-fold PLP-dependent enzyme [Streptomyces sp. 549]MDK1474142.1 aminotransferase class V-fold PLP-dependent enzyme [Streptomyces sp. 549]